MKRVSLTSLLPLILCLPASLLATTHYVDASKNGAGTSWDDAFAHLQDALAAANSGDQIWVAEGTYYPDDGAGQIDNDRSSTFQLKNGVALYGGFLGLASETKLSDRGFRDPPTLSGDLLADDNTTGNNSDNAYHVINGSGTDATAILDGFTIIAGNANGDSPNDSGGALYNSSGSPTLNNCSFDNNYAANNGGAIANESSSSPALTNCYFFENYSSNNGGAIANDSNSSPTLDRCGLWFNSANGWGGAIYNNSYSSPSLSNCDFLENRANSGGAIQNQDAASPILSNCSFWSNSAYSVGGAIMNDSDSSITLNSCYFYENSAGSAGAIGNYTRSSATLNNCSMAENSATSTRLSDLFGGGGAISNPSDCSLSLNNCSLSSNESVDLGGALYNAGDMTLTNCSLVDNQANSGGGGIANEAATSTLTNCIIWGNLSNYSTTSTTASIYNDGSSISNYAHCLIANSGGSDNWASALGTDNGNNIDVDPLFTDLKLRLTTHSPALNAGDGTAATSINSTSDDLAGKTRFLDGIIDMGAYEGGYTTFANDFSDLNPEDDANGNGLSNYADYAMGADPTAAPTTHQATTFHGNQVTFRTRDYATDIKPVYQKSTDLVEWSPMVKNVDYSVISTSSNGTELRVTFVLTPTLLLEPKVFFSQELSTE